MSWSSSQQPKQSRSKSNKSNQMPDFVNLKVEGLDELQRKLAHTPSALQRGIRTAVKGATEMVQDWVSRYPRATEANKPRGFNTMFSLSGRRSVNTWYQRGYGPKWVTKSGAVHGRATSQTLGRSWNVRVVSVANSIVGVTGTRVTYAPHVHDQERQARFHQARGWRTVQDAVRVKGKEIVAFFETMAQLIARELGG